MSPYPVISTSARRIAATQSCQAGDAFRTVVERQLSFYVPGVRVLVAKGPTYGDHESGSPHQTQGGQYYDELGGVTVVQHSI